MKQTHEKKICFPQVGGPLLQVFYIFVPRLFQKQGFIDDVSRFSSIFPAKEGFNRQKVGFWGSTHRSHEPFLPLEMGSPGSRNSVATSNPRNQRYQGTIGSRMDVRMPMDFPFGSWNEKTKWSPVGQLEVKCLCRLIRVVHTILNNLCMLMFWIELSLLHAPHVTKCHPT